MANENLSAAKNAKNDEFYTQYEDIQREVNAYLEYDPDTFRGKTVLLPCDDPEWSNFTKFFAQNFEMLGLKKLISTSYAADSKLKKSDLHKTSDDQYIQLSLFDITDFERQNPLFDEHLTHARGKIFTLTRDTNQSGRIDIDDLQWKYLDGDGDFRSDEVKALRDEADIIVTNPPFSLFREFLAWIMEAEKKFLIIGSQNAITYKEIFHLIKNNMVWIGRGFHNGNAYFGIPNGANNKYANGVYDPETNLVKFRNCTWYTNLDHGRRHQPLSLMSMADNRKFSKHKEIKESGYPHYDNYDAIEVPYSDAIPSDYDGVMGVPISFLDKYCPEQFEIIGMTSGRNEFEKIAWPTKRYINPIQVNKNGTKTNGSKANTRATILLDETPSGTIYYTADNAEKPFQILYARILIRKRCGKE